MPERQTPEQFLAARRRKLASTAKALKTEKGFSLTIKSHNYQCSVTPLPTCVAKALREAINAYLETKNHDKQDT